MKAKLFIWTFGILVLGFQSSRAQHVAEEHEHRFLHPFLVHMALPDEPGDISVRISPFQERLGSVTVRDVGVHIEAGLLPRLGLHVRSDAIQKGDYTELMIMYAPLQNASLSRGVSVFGQISIPTGPVESNKYKTLFGLAARETIGEFLVINANVHVNAKENMAELESSFVFRASEKLYPVFETHSEIAKEERHTSGLFGLKFKVSHHSGLGFGFQFPFTQEKEFDVQTLATVDMAF
jgi:hypothetical protein